MFWAAILKVTEMKWLTCRKLKVCVMFRHKDHEVPGWKTTELLSVLWASFSQCILSVIVCIKLKFIFRNANETPGITENTVAVFCTLSLPTTCIIWIIKNVLNFYLNLDSPPKNCSPFVQQNPWKASALLAPRMSASAALSGTPPWSSVTTWSPLVRVVSHLQLPDAMVTWYPTQVIASTLNTFFTLQLSGCPCRPSFTRCSYLPNLQIHEWLLGIM